MVIPTLSAPVAEPTSPASDSELGVAILLVEDDPTFAAYLTERLGQAGYAIDWAPDGVRALAKLRHKRPDLLLMDLAIPAIDGLSLLRRLRSEDLIGDTPVIVLTGRFSARDVEQATALGVVDYIAKPFDEEVFLAKMHAYTRLSRGGGAVFLNP